MTRIRLRYGGSVRSSNNGGFVLNALKTQATSDTYLISSQLARKQPSVSLYLFAKLEDTRSYITSRSVSETDNTFTTASSPSVKQIFTGSLPSLLLRSIKSSSVIFSTSHAGYHALI